MLHQDMVIPALLHIQAHLDSDLSLDSIASVAGVSPYHFHRCFQAAVGERLKQYVQRLCLERAALQLIIHNATILDVALANGYAAHETFTRAFKRQFNMTPKQYRSNIGGQGDDADNANREEQDIINRYADTYQLSQVRKVRLNPMHLVFLRNIGPYETVDVGLFGQLAAWAESNGHTRPDNVLLGVAHDSPAITAADKLRFDCCLRVDGPAAVESPLSHQQLDGGLFAHASYIGPSLPATYKTYLRVMGVQAGILDRGSDFEYDKLFNLTDAAREALQEDDPSDYQLPDTAFVIFSHQGYIFSWFLLGEGDDPCVYSYSTTESNGEPMRYAESISEYIEKTIDANIAGIHQLEAYRKEQQNRAADD